MSAEVIYLDKVFDKATPLVSRADALAHGLKRYFTGRPCKRGHFSERAATGGRCLMCACADASARYVADPHKARKNGKRTYVKNRDKTLKRIATYREQNAEMLRARESNWRARNRDKVNARGQRRRARKRLAIVTHDADAIMRQITNEGGNCFYCSIGLLPFEGHAEHIMPLSRGGPHAELNLVLSCPTCNLRKSDRLPSEWDRLPQRHAARALARERAIIEWNDAQILGLGDF